MIFSETGKKRGEFVKKFLLFIFLSVPLYGFSFSGHPFRSSINPIKFQPWKFEKEFFKKDFFKTNFMGKATQNSVWLIQNSRVSGTAFSIGPNLVVTNFHVIDALLRDSSIEDIVLRQEGGSLNLSIHQVRQVSALYDLVLIETKEKVVNYTTVKSGEIQPYENLFVLGYPRGKFKEMKKTGRVIEEDDQQYVFPVDNSFLQGGSGGPVLDAKGRVVGVLSVVYGNISIAIKSKHLNEVIVGEHHLDCSDFINPSACMEKEMENLEAIARQGNAYSQYRLARYYEEKGMENLEAIARQENVYAQYRSAGYYEAQETNQDLVLAFDWMEKSASQGYMYAQNHLGNMYFNGRGIARDMDQAFDWYKRSAKQGYFLAQSNLANMYYQGKGTRPDKKMAFDLKERSAKQGYITAQKDLAGMLFLGEGTKRNLQLVAYWLTAFTKQGGHVGKKSPYNTSYP